MATYLARVCLGYSFALEHAGELGKPFIKINDALPARAEAKNELYRFTYGIYRLNALSEDDCRGLLRTAVSECFPELDDGAVRIFIVKDGADDTAKLMEEIYRGLYGVDDYLELTTGLSKSIPLLEEKKALPALRLQSYLFAVDPGCGFTTLLSSLGNFFMRMKVFGEDSAKRVNYTEYVVYKENDGERISINDLIDALFEAGDEPTNSIIGIDLAYFLDGSKYDELRRFINRLFRFQDRYVFMFRVPYLEKKAIDEVEKVLSDLLILRTIKVPPLHEVVLLETLWDRVTSCGYMPDPSIFDVFLAKIRIEKKDGRFYGFKSAEKISNELVLRKAASEAAKLTADQTAPSGGKYIYPEDLPGFADEKKEKNGYDELNELIGMETIAARVREIVAQVKMSMANEKLDRPCIHMRFLGAPGTGKTTVARIIGQIFREEGILRKGAFMEYTARSLCAEYVGQTAVRTASICRDAYGSVLFLDEAYALYTDGQSANDYGKEALTTLISEMENHRDDMLVIMAGYTDDMETLMKGNAGLRSRMPYALTFPNYTREQLFEIYMQMVRKHFSYTPALESAVKEYFTTLSQSYISSKEFANARFARNLYERTWSKAALRAALAGKSTVTLDKEDFIAASGEKEFSEKLERKTHIGF